MNELLILGILLAVFAAACLFDWFTAEILRARLERLCVRLKLWAARLLWRVLDRLDCELTAWYVARIAKRRVREAWRRAGGEPDAGRNRL